MPRRFHLGPIRKNNERKRQRCSKNGVGRPRKRNLISIRDLRAELTLPTGGEWVDKSDEDAVIVCRVQKDCTQTVSVTHTISVSSDFTWCVKVHGKDVHIAQCSALKSLPIKINTSSLLNNLIKTVNSLQVCAGHPEQKLLEMAKCRKGKFSSPDGRTVAFVDNYFPIVLNGEIYQQTIRTTSCELLVHGPKCDVCKSYRRNLRALLSTRRRKVDKDQGMNGNTCTSSHTNYRYLKTPERKQRMVNLKAELKSCKEEVEKLKAKLEAIREEKGVHVDEALHRDLEAIMKERTDEIESKYPPNSFHRLFWEQQLEAMKVKDARQVRWHPMMVKWCLSMKLLSPCAYHALRSSNLLVLPSERTLRDYTHFIKAKAGFQAEVDQQLCREAKIESIPEYQKFVCLVFDEVKIKEDLVYDKHSAEVVGFVNVGDVNNQLLQFERACKSNSSCNHHLATHMLTFMVRGVLSDLEFPYAQFASSSITADQLYSLVWGCVRRLEACGFKVIALTSDGASPNRKFYNMLKLADEDDPVYKTSNPYSDEERPIYFLSDPPHLIKTVRNGWSNSFGHTRTRQLWINGQSISWQHLVDLYHKHHGNGKLGSGLSMLKKLKWEHIKLTSYSKMRVDLAAQVLSKSVADALKFDGDPETEETERFVRTFDKFFDLFNVRSLRECILKRKPNVRPYRSATDERLKVIVINTWLETDFLSYLNEWDASVATRTDIGAAVRTKMCLSRETRLGLRITVKSFVEMARYLLSQEGVCYFLSEKLNQDPLESFFGKQRMRCGYNENPNAISFLYGTSSLRVQGSTALKPLRGNCKRGRENTPIIVDDTPLPKRPRSQALN